MGHPSSKNRLIFVSCGQAADHEVLVGQTIKATIDAEAGFEAYFADSVQDLEGLSGHVFDALRRCVGIISVLHARGKVVGGDGTSSLRSSTWVNQEIAITSFRQFYESRPLPILAFAEQGVILEGAMTALIVNPRPLVPGTIARDIKSWLNEIGGAAHIPDADAEFDDKWANLSEKAVMVLDCMAREGGQDVPEDLIWQSLGRYGLSHDNQAMVAAKNDFGRTGLVRIRRDRSVFFLTVPDVWHWHVQRALNKWRTERENS